MWKPFVHSAHLVAVIKWIAKKYTHVGIDISMRIQPWTTYFFLLYFACICLHGIVVAAAAALLCFIFSWLSVVSTWIFDEWIQINTTNWWINLMIWGKWLVFICFFLRTWNLIIFQFRSWHIMWNCPNSKWIHWALT